MVFLFIGGKKRKHTKTSTKTKKVEFCTEATWLSFLKKTTSCYIGNYNSSCKEVIKMSISMVINLFMCIITSYNALTLHSLTKLGRMLHFIYFYRYVWRFTYIYIYISYRWSVEILSLESWEEIKKKMVTWRKKRRTAKKRNKKKFCFWNRDWVLGESTEQCITLPLYMRKEQESSGSSPWLQKAIKKRKESI